MGKTRKNVNAILDIANAFRTVLIAKDPGFNMDKITKKMDSLYNEIRKQGFKLIAEDEKPKDPREADKIMRDIMKEGDLTPELLKEIKRYFRQNKKPKKPESE
jgi:hypothetical protein